MTKLTRGRWYGRIDHLVRAFDSNLLLGILFLFALDVSFIAIYLLGQIYDLALDLRWHIESDHSYAEMFGYVKLASVAVLLIATFGLSKERTYLMWAGVFTYILLDDVLLIHQRLGSAFADHSSSTWNMGQLAVWILVGMILLATTVGMLARSSGDDRTNGILLFTMLMALGFFAVVALPEPFDPGGLKSVCQAPKQSVADRRPSRPILLVPCSVAPSLPMNC